MSPAAIRVGLTAPLLLTLCACDFDDFDTGNRENEDFHYSYNLKTGGRLELENFNGSVEISGWDQDKVEINGTKYANSRERLQQIKVEITDSPDAIRIRTTRPEDRRGNMGVKYIITVPRKTILERIT